MTATDSLSRKFGALELPLTADTSTEDAAHLDPARDILLDLFAAALNSELEPVWASAVVGTPIAESQPVAFKLPGRLTEETLKQVKAAWPMLSVGRGDAPAGVTKFTLDQRALTYRWDIDYVLSPLTSVNLARVDAVLVAVGKTIIETVAARGHKAYRTYTTQGSIYASDVLGGGNDCCEFYTCEVVDMALGPAEISKGGPKYYACSLTLETVEISDFPGDGEDDGEAVPLIGTTATFGVTESGEPAIIVRD
jgi:hypothetical protein